MTPLKSLTQKTVTMDNEERIKEIHAVELDLLEKFADLCGRLNLHYTLSSGTLLGAVRHKGFIPWDDDIDVAMPRKDYEILIRNGNELLPEGYFLQHYSTEKQAPNVFAKLRNSNTTWICYEHEKLNINHGIGMDIFPIDRFSDPQKLKKIARKTKRLITLINCNDLTYIRTIKNPLKKMIGFLLLPISKIIGKRRLLIKQDKFNKGDMIGEWTTADVILRNKIMPYEIFEEYEDVEFENEKFSAIKERDRYLRQIYGLNYMELPPPEKRVIHIAKTVDCNKPYTEYTNYKSK